jgi:hypothetical protein
MNRAAAVVVVLFAWVLAWGAWGEPGLLAEYGDGKATIHTGVMNPALALKENESVHPQVGVKFTAKYEGAIKILRRAC